ARLLAPYRAFLAQPDVPAMIACAWLSRMPVAMNGLAMLLFMRAELGNFAAAGTIVGAFFVAMAVAAPIEGRLIDRFGPKWPLRVAGTLHPLFLLALFWQGTQHASQGLLTAIAVGCGLFAPPVTILTRTTWRHRFEDEANRKMAYSIDSVMIELNFTAGPLVVAALVAALDAAQGFAVVIGVSITALLIFLASPILKYWKTGPAADRHLLGPLTNPRLVLLFVMTFGLTLCFGFLEVGYPAYATLIGSVSLGGVLLALNALGSGTGGFLYGAIHTSMPLERQFALALGIMSLPLFFHGPVDSAIGFCVLAFVSGLMIAPALTAQTLLITRLAPPQYATEAFTWSSTFIVTGIGIGMAAGGVLAERVHPKAPFLCGGLIVLGMALLASWWLPAGRDHPSRH
ncbi:MAG TPA: MFS transporter, partial [Usitatibacteraceae bacterium]|nr:MFS transporter [Usitatibacteraceae bacterium]